MHSRKVNDKKARTFKYTLVWSKLYGLVDFKFLLIITINPVEEPSRTQITDIDFMVTNHSGQLSWLINIRYWKRVVMETGTWESANTIKNPICYRNVFSHASKKIESTKNKWTEGAGTLLSDVLLRLSVIVSDTPQSYLLKGNKTVKK